MPPHVPERQANREPGSLGPFAAVLSWLSCDTLESTVASRHNYGAVFIFDEPYRSKANLIFQA
jgi:hypothetical protein